jgi:cellulose synthase operon protein C
MNIVSAVLVYRCAINFNSDSRLRIKMNGLIRIIAVVLCCICLNACDRSAKQKVDEANRHLNTARTYQQQGQWRAAMIEARNAASKGEHPQEGLALLADIYMQIGANQAAAELLEKIAKDDLELNLQWARALIAERKYQSARKVLLNIPEATRNNSVHFHQLVVQMAAQDGDFSLAQEHLTQLASLVANPQELAYWRAQLIAAQGDWAEAQQLLKQWVAEKPNDGQAWVLLGQIALTANQLEDAETYLSKALSLVPTGDMLSAAKARVLNLLTEVLTRLGRSDEAYRYQKILAEANPEGAAAQQKFNQALELYQKGDFAQAQTVITELKKQFPQDKNTNTLLGLVQLQQGDTKQAEALFDAAVDPETAAPRVLQAAALSKVRNQQIDEAVALLKKAAETQPKSAEILATYGIALLDKNSQDSEALTWLDKSLQLNQNQPKIYMAKARYYSAQNNLAEAIAQLRMAVAQNPQHFESQQVLFQLMLANKQLDTIVQTIDALPAELAGRKYFWQGWLALQQKNYPQALSLFEKSVPISDAEKYLPLAGMAQAYQDQLDWSRAFSAWQQVINAAPQFMPAYQHYLTAAKNIHQLEQAEIFLAAQSRAEENWQANWVLAQWFAANNDIDKAIVNAQEVLRKAMQLPGIKQLLVSLYTQKAQSLRISDLLHSRDWINKALTLQPENPAILTFLVELELADKKIPQARTIIAEYAKGNAEPAVLNFLNGLALLAEGKKVEALALLQNSFNARPMDKTAELIYSTYAQSDEAKSQDFLAQWRKALPQSARPLIIQALAAQSAGDKSTAISAYEEALRLQAPSVLALNNLAWLYFETRDPRAQDTAHRAVTLAPQSAEVLDTYGWILVQTGKKAEGISWLEKAKALAPTMPEILKHLDEAKKR